MLEKEKSGSQVVERTCAILKDIARHGLLGARLIDVTNSTGLSRPTVHRILASLVMQNFLQRTPDRRYQLAPLMHEMGLSAPNPIGDPERFRRIIQSLADQCGDTVYLAMRRGEFCHYILRCEGAYPVRTHVVSANQTLHLVSGHSGRALLAAMPEKEAEDIIVQASTSLSLFGEATPQSLRDEVYRAREKGYGWSRDVTFIGVAGLTIAVPNTNGIPYLALTISAIPQRLMPDRAESLLPMLQKASHDIAELMSQSD